MNDVKQFVSSCDVCQRVDGKLGKQHLIDYYRLIYFTIRQRGRVVYERIVNELSNCFNIHCYPNKNTSHLIFYL